MSSSRGQDFRVLRKRVVDQPLPETGGVDPVLADQRPHQVRVPWEGGAHINELISSLDIRQDEEDAGAEEET